MKYIWVVKPPSGYPERGRTGGKAILTADHPPKRILMRGSVGEAWGSLGVTRDGEFPRLQRRSTGDQLGDLPPQGVRFHHGIGPADGATASGPHPSILLT